MRAALLAVARLAGVAFAKGGATAQKRYDPGASDSETKISPTNSRPIHPMQRQRLDGDRWVLFGGVVGG